MDAEFPFRIGDVLAGKYLLERVIGSGGMGVVFAANHLELQRRVAIKLLRPDQCDHEGSVARLMQEARAVARLNGPHVAKVLDVGRLESGLPYLIMELLEGCNLHDLIQEHGALSSVQAADYTLQACEAVAEAHRVGVVHRDLKPGNLFLTRDAYGEPMIKVLDFGISKILQPCDSSEVGLTDSRCMIGSPVYMSPEQMHSARDVDHRCDIWGLGTILFEMLVGRPVWQGQTFSDLCAQIMRDPCPKLRELRPEISPELATVVERCLRKDPVARYQQVSDLALALAPSASQGGRASARRVLQIAGQPSAAELSVTSSQSLETSGDPFSTASALPATALTRLTRRARARVVPALAASVLLLIGWWLLRAQSSGIDTKQRPLSVQSAPSPSSSAQLAIGATSMPLPSAPPLSSPLMASSQPTDASSPTDAAVPVTTARGSFGTPRVPSQRPANRPSTEAPGASIDPMSIRTLTPTRVVDPMSLRK